MRKLSIVFMFLLATFFTTSAIGAGSYPDWLLPELRKYPIEKYIFDIGRSEGIGEKAYKRAIAEANKKVSEKILRQAVRIIQVNSDKENYQMVLEHYSASLEDYCSWHYKAPALKIEGLKARNLSVDNVRNENETFAVVYIEREKLIDIYKNHESQIKNKIKRFLETAQGAEDDLERKRAVKTYYRTYPLYESLKEAEIIQIGAEYKPNYRQSFRKLADSATKTTGTPLPHRNVIKRVQELEDETIVNFNDIHRVLGSQLLTQILSPNDWVAVYPLIYEDSEMPSPFALRFTKTLKEEFPDWVLVDHMLDLPQMPVNLDEINQDPLPLRLSSSCWENGDEITIRVSLRNIDTGEFLASSVVEFLKTKMRDTLTYQPRGYNQAQNEKKAFNPRYYVRDKHLGNEALKEHQDAPIGGLKVDIRTNKRRGPLTYSDGDKVTVYARVNQPAYLRLLNTHADRKRVLLRDNFYIGPENVNKNVEIGTFWCHPPYGVELLNVAARTEEFPPIETILKDDYHYLIEQDPDQAAAKFRGLKPIPKQKHDDQIPGPKPIIDEQPSFQQSEAQLVITISEK